MKHKNASPDQFALFNEPPRLREVSDELGVIGVRADQAEHHDVAPEPDLSGAAILLADRAMAMSDVLKYYALLARNDGIAKIRAKSPDNKFDNRYAYRADDIHAEADYKLAAAEAAYWQAIDTLTAGDAIRASVEESTEDDVKLYRTTIKSELNDQFRTGFNKAAPENRAEAKQSLGIDTKSSKKAS